MFNLAMKEKNKNIRLSFEKIAELLKKIVHQSKKPKMCR